MFQYRSGKTEGRRMNPDFSYRHLHYFWVVATEGGMSRAAERLGMAVQTISTQVRTLETSLGVTLLKPEGRGLVLTEAGQAALRVADQIFQLGQSLPEVVRDAAASQGVRLVVGIPDGLPKPAVRHLLQPVLDEPRLRLVCHDDEFDRLLGELALHRLDLVLSDRPAPTNPSLKLYSHPVGRSGVAWYATPERAHELEKAQRKAGSFAQALAQVPVLLPTGHGVLRGALDHWLERHGLRVRIAGEFEDSALMQTFGASGLGVFPAATVGEDELTARLGLVRVGECDGVEEQFFAITPRKRIEHRLVQRLTQVAVG